MTTRVLSALVIAASAVACMNETAGLGGSRESQPSASSNAEASAEHRFPDPDDTTSPSNSWSPPAYDSMDAGRPGAFTCAYSWLPVPTSHACQYELPTERQNESPDLDAKTWDPRNVRVDVWPETQGKWIGGYKAAFDSCGSEHGWYYLTTSASRPTRYMLCPTSCAVVSNGGGFRLAAFGWCG
ncbi:MAG: hypothetical protein KF764_26015 [Labilithrix sp.]|nr:hypothetical protein [Labilithrix sp.]